jgi:hypothetical protein
MIDTVTSENIDFSTWIIAYKSGRGGGVAQSLSAGEEVLLTYT